MTNNQRHTTFKTAAPQPQIDRKEAAMTPAIVAGEWVEFVEEADIMAYEKRTKDLANSREIIIKQRAVKLGQFVVEAGEWLGVKLGLILLALIVFVASTSWAFVVAFVGGIMGLFPVWTIENDDDVDNWEGENCSCKTGNTINININQNNEK